MRSAMRWANSRVGHICLRGVLLFAGLLLACVDTSWAVVSLDTVIHHEGGSSPKTVSGTIAANSDRVLIAYVHMEDGGTSVSGLGVTWNGVSMTAIGSSYSFSTGFTLYAFGLIAPDTGTHDLVLSWSGGGVNWTVVTAMAFYGADQTTAWQNRTTASGTSAAPSISVTSSNGNMATAAYMHTGSADTFVEVNGTEAYASEPWETLYRASTGGSTTISGTTTSSWTWGMLGVDVVQVGGGASAETFGFRKRRMQ